MNLSFYTASAANTNISAIALNPAISLTHNQFLLPAVFNIWSPHNGVNFVGDVRYYIYPTYTYGLGSNTSLSNDNLINYSYIRVYQEVLKHIYSDFYGGLSYNLDYHFGIKVIETDGLGTDFEQYNNNATKTTSSGVSAILIYDSRKNSNNPVDATYFSVSYRSNFTFLGSDANWQGFQGEFRKYIALFHNPRHILAFWNLNWYNFGGKSPYLDLPSTGWDSYSNTGRGYIQGRLRGTGFEYAEAEYRFCLTKNGLLGGVVFTNAESVAQSNTLHFENLLPGYGFGLRVKANKKSSVNFAIDYGFGTQGSQGFAFNVSEVF